MIQNIFFTHCTYFLLPNDLAIFSGSYNYYLGRNDKLVLSKDKSFNIIQGAPSINPIYPSEPDGSLVIAKLTHDPYTGYIPTEAPNGFVSNLSIQKVKHKLSGSHVRKRREISVFFVACMYMCMYVRI